jgi:hypothetical protein
MAKKWRMNAAEPAKKQKRKTKSPRRSRTPKNAVQRLRRRTKLAKTFPVLVLLAPVLAVARAAVPALLLPVPVLAVARAAVLAHVRLAVVLAPPHAAVLAHVLPAPVLALRRWCLFHQLPALTAAKTVVILPAGCTAGCVWVLDVATCVLALGWRRSSNDGAAAAAAHLASLFLRWCAGRNFVTPWTPWPWGAENGVLH